MRRGALTSSVSTRAILALSSLVFPLPGPASTTQCWLGSNASHCSTFAHGALSRFVDVHSLALDLSSDVLKGAEHVFRTPSTTIVGPLENGCGGC